MAVCLCMLLASSSLSKGAPYTSMVLVLTPVWLVEVDIGSSPVAIATVRHCWVCCNPPPLLPLILPCPPEII